MIVKLIDNQSFIFLCSLNPWLIIVFANWNKQKKKITIENLKNGRGT